MRRILLLLLFAQFTFLSAFAQDRLLSGNVKDETGAPLPGVTVLVKGTTTGTITDVDGNFKLNAPEDAQTLVFQYIGYENKEVAVGTQTSFNVSLTTDTKQLEEVVVTAIGVEQKKRTLGYALQTVNSDELVKATESNIVNSLAGKVAGVQINSSGGQAGSSSRIVIRGNTSLSGTNAPLFVIDGIPIDNSQNTANSGVESTLFGGTQSNRAIDLDPNVIEDVTVLKGAAATVLYGSRGANGVIMITTKRGKDTGGKPRVEISSRYGIDRPIVRGFQDEFLQGIGGNYRNGLPAGEGGFRSLDPETNPTGATASQGSTSWGPSINNIDQFTLDSIGVPQIFDPRREFYRNAKVWENNVRVLGGSDKLNYLLSFSNLEQEGIAPGNRFDRKNLTATINAKLSEKLRYTGTTRYTNSYNSRLTEGNGQRSYLYALNYWPISHDINKYYTESGEYYSFVNNAFNNPFWLAENNGRFSRVNRFTINQQLDYDVLPWLKVTNRFGLDAYHDANEDHVNVGTRGTPNGRLYTADITNYEINNDLMLTVDKQINDDFAITGLLGNNINSRKYKNSLMVGTNLNIPSFFDISNVSTVQAYEFDQEIRSFSLYAKVGFEFRNMLFLNLQGRNDWSSTLPVEDRSYLYGSADVSFVFTELLQIDQNILPYGKLRLSYSQAGNTAPAYSTIQTFNQSDTGDGTRGVINIPTQGQNAFELDNVQTNNQLQHELISEFEVGADLKFWNNRVGLDFAYYNRESDNQIVTASVTPTTGFTNRIVNAGQIKNEGVELTLTGTPVDLQNGFRWDVQVNYARNRTTVGKLADGIESIFLYGFTSPQIRADVNNGYGVIWGERFLRNDKGRLVIGNNGLPIQDSSLGSIGNVQPDWTGGIRNTFSYKGLTLSALFDARIGGDILNFDLFYMTYYGTAELTEDRGSVIVWDGVIDNGDGTYRENDIPVVKDGAYYRNFYSNSTELFVEDASFIKLRELSLSYNLPSSLLDRLPVENVSFSVIARNLFIASNFSFWDPEGSLGGNGNGQGFYHSVTPGTRGISFGINVSL